MKLRCLLVAISMFVLLAASAPSGNAQMAADRGPAARANLQSQDSVEALRRQLAQDPNDVVALKGLAQQLEAAGQSRDAALLLERLVQLEPRNFDAMYRLGSMKSWQDTEKREALDLLRRSCDGSNGNPEYCGAYAEVLSWRSESRDEAVARLQQIVSDHPDALSSRLKLAQVLSWNSATRAQAAELYDEGLQLDPSNVELLVASAELLSWSKPERGRAIARYNQVLEHYPDEPRALTGKAQLLSWQGRTAEALALYDRALEKNPANAAALRGKAEILNWKGRYAEARSLAQAAQNAAPADDRTRLELARADIGLRRFGEAQQAMAEVKGPPGPGFNDARQEIHRGMGTWLDLGYADRREHNLAFDRFAMSLSTPLAPGHRVTLSYRPTLFDGDSAGFNTNYFQASLDSDAGDKFSSHIQLGAETFHNVPFVIDGGVDLRYKPLTSTVVKLAFLREPVEESLLSRRGLDLGFFQGQVRSNLATVGIGYYNAAHKLDASMDYTDGTYTGQNLDANRRYSVEGQVGRALHSDRPYLRLAYGVNYSSFDHDADIQNVVMLPGVTGGYFSPTRFLLNQGIVNATYRFSSKVVWEATGTAGVQNVETNTASFSNAQFASSFNNLLFWRITPLNELNFGYEYLNVYNAFHRHLYRFTWRHYF